MSNIIYLYNSVSRFLDYIKISKTTTFKSPFKPVLQILFLLFNAWVLVFTLIDRPKESLIGLAVLGVGGIIYYFDRPAISNDEARI